ncbi:sigma-70 family RNA polymerase sigma factor [Halomonas campisalis]|uniref:Sigma-70 family RNA polymerase sigma factor n=1 Tax=Billgrantia campisalis TaxID=74661 RepID=A0ABS9P7N6_9GAMM|nr:sigma-70 family RNA polymerase sigma factor [Halomonas campisalis]MCG6657775.1 sigma-70 family RNA polymerase sigma factor [Halomonas campisalis]MDR5862453.1 sigma-70 family RNA polymerase sigma factor [Halomonas campisalis]
MTAHTDLDALFQRHATDLTGYLRRQLHCPHLAEDLCQEAFLRLGQHPELGRLVESRAYLFRIARNLIIDHHRRLRSRPVCQPLDEPALCLDCPRACPERNADSALCRRALYAALATLPPRLRQALVWHRIEGLTQAEIGHRLDVSERMAGRYVAQAIARCREQLSVSPTRQR